MVSISSDNPSIERAFKDLLETLKEAGSGFHSNLCIEASSSNIRVSTKDPMQKGKEIIRIPRNALMPGDQYITSLQGDDLQIDFPINSTLHERQKTIIKQMFEIYNLTKKIPEHKELCFVLSLKDYPSLMKMFGENRAVNPKYDQWFEALQNDSMNKDQYARFLIDTFIQTRPLGYSDPVREDNMSTIMPIIDFMNHHWSGANFAVVNGVRRGDLAIATSQPFPGNTECYAFYGVLDACDSLVRYNFVDQGAPIVRSVKAELEVPDGRKVIIGNSSHEPAGVKKLPEALSDLIYYASHMCFEEEPDKAPEEQNFWAPFIIFPSKESGAPRAMQRILKYIIEHMYNSFDKKIDFNVKDWVLEAEAKLLQVNRDDYKNLSAHVDELVKEKGASASLERIKTLATRQLQQLDVYEKDAKAFRK
jgi:hypothetical protein